MSSTALTVINNNTELVKRGGIGLGSKLFKLQPATIQLTQRMSRAEGAQVGKLRVKESGQHFDEMTLVLLFEPVERRSYFEGEDYSPDNCICFSLDNVEPDKRAKVPQAMKCATCPKSSWVKYRETGNKKDIPPCKNYWHNLVIDRKTQLPYYLDVKGTSIKPYMSAMQQIARTLAVMESAGDTPNIFDVSFTIFPVSEKNGQYYTYGFKDFAPVGDTDRETFGKIYLDFINRKQSAEEVEAAAAVEAEVNAEVVSGSSNVEEGEIII